MTFRLAAVAFDSRWMKHSTPARTQELLWSKTMWRVKKEELIEAITHLAFYSGWPNAMTAVLLAKEVFEKT
jgi:hypothetical protein